MTATYLIFFFPSKRLLREATVRPAGRGRGDGASGARERTWVTDGVSGGGIEGRPRAPGVEPAATTFVSRRRGVPSTSDLVAAMAGMTDDASGVGKVEARSRRLLAIVLAGPFKLGSSSASGSASWSESMSAEVETPLLAFFPGFAGFGLGLDLSEAFWGSSVGSGSFLGDISMRNSGWCSDNIQRSRPRCTPRSPAKVSLSASRHLLRKSYQREVCRGAAEKRWRTSQLSWVSTAVLW
jgi:hypothetical protein